MLEDRRHASERSIPPGSPVALLASLGYLSADGDGVDDPRTGAKQIKAASVAEPKRIRHLHT